MQRFIAYVDLVVAFMLIPLYLIVTRNRQETVELQDKWSQVWRSQRVDAMTAEKVVEDAEDELSREAQSELKAIQKREDVTQYVHFGPSEPDVWDLGLEFYKCVPEAYKNEIPSEIRVKCMEVAQYLHPKHYTQNVRAYKPPVMGWGLMVDHISGLSTMTYDPKTDTYTIHGKYEPENREGQYGLEIRLN